MNDDAVKIILAVIAIVAPIATALFGWLKGKSVSDTGASDRVQKGFDNLLARYETENARLRKSDQDKDEIIAQLRAELANQ